MKADQDTSNTCRRITLPPGWVPGEGWKGRRTFIVTCQHGTRTLDRIPEVKTLFSRHGHCNAAWKQYMQRPSETDAEHAERLKETFCFTRSGTAFVGFPQTLPSASPKGGSGKQQENTGLSSKRKAPASNALQLAKRKHQAPTPVKPAEGAKAGSTAQAPGKGAHRAAAVQQDKVLKWTKQLQKAGASQPLAKGRPVQPPKHSPAEPGWDSLTADDILGRLQGAAEDFEAKKAGFSMSLEIDTGSAVSAEAMLGREVRILWPEDNAWFSGTVESYDSSSGQHRVLYADGDSESIFLPMERVRLSVSAGEILSAAKSDELTANVQHLLSAADIDDDKAKSGDPSKGDALRGRAAQLLQLADDKSQATVNNSLWEPELMGKPALADIAPPHIEHQDGEPNSSCTAAVSGLAEQQQQSIQHPADLHSKSAHSDAWESLGTVVWAREKGWPHWPALVITKETSRGLCNLRTVKNGCALWFFGTFEMACLRPGEIVSFVEGLQKGLHASCKRSVKLFRAALQQTHCYLQTGRLPDQMILDNNDEVWYDEAEEIDEAMDLDGTEFPLRLGKNLQVLTLGRIEWMRPTYHTKKHIFPVGYSAVRAVELSAARGTPVQCLCEIGESADSFEPIFRVTPEKGPAEVASNPTKAWRALLERHGLAKRAAGLSGLRMFGLDTPTVAKLIQSLPHAARCTSFEAWAREKPEAVPLMPEEVAQQLSLAASCQRLPEGIRSVEALDGSQGSCSVCGEEEETDANHLLQCDGCRGFAHMACYGVPSPPEGRLWLCDLCKLGPERRPACALCPVSGGLMRRTTCGHWVHATCALWTPGTWINSETGLVEGLSKLPKARFQLSCSLCSQTYGACIQCAGSRQCFAAFHPTCAAKEGLRMVAVDDGEGPDSDSDADERATHAEPEKMMSSGEMAGALQPGQEPHIDGLARDTQLGEEDLRNTTAELEQALHEGLADSSARPVHLQGNTPAVHTMDHVQGEQPAKDGGITPQKPQKSVPVISVLADCTEEVSSREPLAIIQIPQQHADGVPGRIPALSGPTSGKEQSEKSNAQHSTDSAEQPSMQASQAMPVVLKTSTKQVAGEQPAVQPGAADMAQLKLLASSSPLGSLPDPGALQASSAPHPSAACPAPGSSTGDAASPEGERRPLSKTAGASAAEPKSLGSPASPAQQAPALRKRPVRSKRAWKEGTYIGNGLWLMCYCSRHRRALEEMGASRAVVSVTTGQGLQDALSPQPKARQTPGRPQSMPEAERPQAVPIVGCPDEHAPSSRESAYNHQLRRHQRAPDAMAAALAKRAFVRETPYLVTTAALPRPAGQLAAPCGPPFVPLIDTSHVGQGPAGPPTAAASQQAGAAASKQAAAMQMPAVPLELACSSQHPTMPPLALSPQQAGLGKEAGCSEDASSRRSPRLDQKRATGRLASYKRGTKKPRTEHAQHAQDLQAPEAAAQETNISVCEGKPAANTKYRESNSMQGEATIDRLPSIRSRDPSQLTAQVEGACTAGRACTGAAAEQPSAAQQTVQSLAERYSDMKSTVMERLTCGKSAIHGWGAFTKRAHAEGDMLIEYAGELVRRSVADTRERRCYDKLVGAGTYVFGLNKDVCVDATRAGNMAHLLNHSCEPNAYSRTITVRCMETGKLSDHVVIFARRSIKAGKELTYDYRFSGIEKLSCNCGAPSCRGFVNAARSRLDGNAQMVLRSRLKPYTGQKLTWDAEKAAA